MVRLCALYGFEDYLDHLNRATTITGTQKGSEPRKTEIYSTNTPNEQSEKEPWCPALTQSTP